MLCCKGGPSGRPFYGHAGDCPQCAKPVVRDWKVQFYSGVVMPASIPDVVAKAGMDGAFRQTEAMLADAGRIHRLTIISPNGDSIDLAIEVNKHGSQVGDFNIVGPDGGMNIPSEVRMVMALFMALDFLGVAHLVKIGAVDGIK